jgi:hypothetical protein
VIRHVVSASILDSRKCSADSKVVVLYPKDSTSSRMPSRASASSSTIEIQWNFGHLRPGRKVSQTKTAMERQFTFKKFDLAQLADGCVFFAWRSFASALSLGCARGRSWAQNPASTRKKRAPVLIGNKLDWRTIKCLQLRALKDRINRPLIKPLAFTQQIGTVSRPQGVVGVMGSE